MTQTSVLILGGSGMLGSMLVDYLSRDQSLSVSATVRTAATQARCNAIWPRAAWLIADFAHAPASQDLWTSLGKPEWILNAIGITKPLIRDSCSEEVFRAVEINSLLPYRIGEFAAASGGRVLQIATDCVFSGKRGQYCERDAHDALDVYGKTKSLGECPLANVHHLRCSIIGPEPKDHKFLLDWFRGQPAGAELNGFINHRWNGLTTLAFARICRGIISDCAVADHVQHVVPQGPVTKAEMLTAFARSYRRPDISIRPVEAKEVIDRTLSTDYPERNAALWRAAGYASIPSIEELIAELAGYDYAADRVAEPRP